MFKPWVALLIAASACTTAPRHTALPAEQPQRPGAITMADFSTSVIIRASQPERAANPTRPTIAILFASWCGPCHSELAVLNRLRQAHPNLRVVGMSYAPFEEFNDHGDATRLREFVSADAPWLNVYAMPQALYERLHQPSKIPTLWLFAADGTLAQTYDRAVRRAPDFDELNAAVMQLAASKP